MQNPFEKIIVTALICISLMVGSLHADELEVVIRGVNEPVLSNVRSMVEPFRLLGVSRLSRRRLEALREESEDGAREALKPFGYYQPDIKTRTEKTGKKSWRLLVDIETGKPVLISELNLQLTGPGLALPELQAWRSSWPLVPGARLVQPEWDNRLREALDILANGGYLLAKFTRRSMRVDLDRNEAVLDLVLDTGEQALMGEVRFHQDIVNPGILENLPRFSAGDPYDSWLMERFHIDVWRTGYFGNTDIVEDRHLDVSPPYVDLDVTVAPRKPNTYQGTLGIGSDTGPRVKFTWNRHLLSRRGDSLSVATGWQDHNDEFFVRGAYRIPRKQIARQFWIADAILKRQNEDLKVRDNSPDEELFTLANTDIADYSFKLGRLKIYNRSHGYQQLFETIYVQHLLEDISYRVNEPVLGEGVVLPNENNSSDPLVRQNQSLALGVEYEMPFIRGRGFDTTGQVHRAWAFHSNKAWGSDETFSQLYVSSRWNLKASDRWKFLLRGEVGYTSSDINEVVVPINGQAVHLSVTRLPNLYRFKAGGSSSVRGYGFEQLSNNNIGSNNIVTASAEVELKLVDKWSAAAFFDIGNAFNAWNEMDLKKGIGVGIRWYTVAGAVQVDVARGLDLEGDPWRVHFTIGTSLL